MSNCWNRCGFVEEPSHLHCRSHNKHVLITNYKSNDTNLEGTYSVAVLYYVCLMYMSVQVQVYVSVEAKSDFHYFSLCSPSYFLR